MWHCILHLSKSHSRVGTETHVYGLLVAIIAIHMMHKRAIVGTRYYRLAPLPSKQTASINRNKAAAASQKLDFPLALPLHARFVQDPIFSSSSLQSKNR